MQVRQVRIWFRSQLAVLYEYLGCNVEYTFNKERSCKLYMISYESL